MLTNAPTPRSLPTQFELESFRSLPEHLQPATTEFYGFRPHGWRPSASSAVEPLRIAPESSIAPNSAETLFQLQVAEASSKPCPSAPLYDGHVVLGLRNSGLADVAERIGARHFLEGDFRQSVIDAAKNPRIKISVVLDGLDGDTPLQQILNAVEDGTANGMTNSFTNWELSMLSRFGRLPDVDFIVDGQVIPNPFSQR
jgi:hypothetical protein